MIICNIIGGLGNQMFQYAHGRTLSRSTGQDLRLSVDQFHLFHMHNGLEIDRTFRVKSQLATNDDLRSVLGWQSAPRIRRWLAHPAFVAMRKSTWRAELNCSYSPVLASGLESVYLHGYWQSARYFSDQQPAIRSDFEFDIPWDEQDLAVRERIEAGPSVSVHVRRGDYTSKKNSGVYAACELDYYRAGLRYVRERTPDARIFLFSDDPIWAVQHLAPEFGELEVVRHNFGPRSARDMRLMSLTSHHIIANSSFSWWGAWLDPSPDKIVVAPAHWFVKGSKNDDKDLIPDEWVRI